VDAVRVLIKYGASLHVPAANGYTPIQWAIRLQHHVVANELQLAISSNQQEQQNYSYWRKMFEKIHHAIFTIIILSIIIITHFGLSLNSSDSA
jgi:ankyrin repeat protein